MTILVNGSFEGGWTRKTLTGQEFGEIFVPEGWTAFWREGGVPIPWDPQNLIGFARPEMAVINKEAPYLDPPRIYEGYRALKWFSFFKIHDCGILQQVDTQPGQLLMLTGYAHAWYSQRDDPALSEYEQDGLWYRLTDGAPGMALMLGIDPTGGIDPYAGTVIWDKCYIYNRYNSLPLLTAVAEGPRATVFLRSYALWPFKHCDAYWDAVTLDAVDPEPEPEPEPCQGLPREQYARVVNVVPGTATKARYLEIAELAWDAGRQTVGGSYDDAGLGALDDKAAVLWDIPDADKQLYTDWFVKWYPGTRVSFRGAGGTVEPEPEPPPEPPEEEPYYFPLRSKNCIGLHSSFIGAQSMAYIDQARPNVQKFFSAGDAWQAGLRAPGMISIWRKYVDAIPQSTPRQEAQWYIDQYALEVDAAAKALSLTPAQLLQGITGIESANEVIGSNCPDAIKRAVEFDVAFAELCYARFGDGVAPVLLNVAVGNPLESEVELLLPAAQAVEDYFGFIGYHAYWAANTTQSFLVSGWPYHAGRWMEWDKVFTAHGVYPRYAATEGGICYAPDGWAFDPGKGWRACGPFDRYLTDIAEYNRRVAEWNKAHGNRCAGMTIFCAYQWNWDSFLLGDGEIATLMGWASGTQLAALSYAQSAAARAAQAWGYLNEASYLMPEDRVRLKTALERAAQ